MCYLYNYDCYIVYYEEIIDDLLCKPQLCKSY